jgi:RNA polymerase sigma-70 factor (ECF subfamily)
MSMKDVVKRSRPNAEALPAEDRGAEEGLLEPEDLQRFRSGDRDVLGKLYRIHAPSVSEMLRRGFEFSSRGQSCRFGGLGSAADVEVALQEVFVRVFGASGRHGYDGARSFRAYLIGIARNYCIDLARSRRVEQDGLARLSLEVDQGAPAMPEQAVERSEMAEVIGTFIARLSPMEREVFEQCLCRRITHIEVAKGLGVHRLRVWRTARRLKQALRRHLEDSGHDIGGSGPAARRGASEDAEED